MRKLSHVLITGGAGFIGSNLIRYLFTQTSFKGTIINLDKLTYAGNRYNLSDIEKSFSSRYFFEKGDICDMEAVQEIFKKYDIDTVIHLAAESHVDRSILGPFEFINTNIIGTFNLLETVRSTWKNRRDVLFHHVSTDEVYGSLGETGSFLETTSYSPRSPYSASKAASDHLVRSYYHTYNLPVTVSNCSNNYGPYQFPEKLIPLMILHMLEGKFLPVYGDGKQVRDWLHVEDHCSAIWAIIQNGNLGETYNIGGEEEKENIVLINLLCEEVAKSKGLEINTYKKLITHTKDRLGHDRRYSINCEKIKTCLGWKQAYDFKNGIQRTTEWYLSNLSWIEQVKSGEYNKWIETNYN